MYVLVHFSLTIRAVFFKLKNNPPALAANFQELPSVGLSVGYVEVTFKKTTFNSILRNQFLK